MAYPKVDVDKTIYNIQISYSMISKYIIYKILPNTSKRIIVSKIYSRSPSYMHDFCITKNYIILVACPLVTHGENLLKKRNSFIGAHSWKPNKKTKIYIINKKTGKKFEYQTDSFFFFHLVTAYEENNHIKLILNTYKDYKKVLEVGFYPFCKLDDGRLNEINIDLSTKTINRKFISNESFELYTTNSEFKNKKRYFYSIWAPKDKKALGLIKYDLITNKFKKYLEHENIYYGEPLFIQNPNSNNEDSGIVLSVGFDELQNKNYLLMLDAENFEVISRAELPMNLPFGLHGKFFK